MNNEKFYVSTIYIHTSIYALVCIFVHFFVGCSQRFWNHLLCDQNPLKLRYTYKKSKEMLILGTGELEIV